VFAAPTTPLCAAMMTHSSQRARARAATDCLVGALRVALGGIFVEGVGACADSLEPLVSRAPLLAADVNGGVMV
jgi:hypothetical protein